MKGYPNASNYHFSPGFDQQFLFELYGDDMKSAEEVFQSAINQIDLDLAEAAALYSSGDITTLRKIFHRMKPLFGYVGLLPVQDYVQQFEDNCIRLRGGDALQLAFDNIVQIVNEAVGSIREEKEKLCSYNRRRA